MAAPFNEYVKRRWQQLIEEFGAACMHCGLQWDLQFAHKEPTHCVGRSRGKSRRLKDVLNNRDKYLLLCIDCHADFDGRTRPRRTDRGQTGNDE